MKICDHPIISIYVDKSMWQCNSCPGKGPYPFGTVLTASTVYNYSRAVMATCLAFFMFAAFADAQHKTGFIPIGFAQPKSAPIAMTLIELTGKVGEITRLDAKFAGEVAWFVPDAELRKPERSEAIPGIKRMLIVPHAGGTYTVVAFSVDGTKPVYQEFRITVAGGPAPIPPGPVPIPVPVPNKLDGDMKAAVKADIAAGKGTDKDRETLWAGFKVVHSFMDNTQMKTVGDVQLTLKATLGAVMPKGSLPTVAKVIGDHMAARITEGAAAPLTTELRAKFRATFDEIIVALEKSK